ncbi:hypothetical protein [Azonexus hydrophilus]|uniref:Uncharacterized protein n=1 Tax=Azonexus hydrophilus TaxID=418702 RepID=A0ABZ2XEC3_9RHOO
MQNHFLKAETAEALRAALIAAGVLVASDAGDLLAEGCALDVIGTIHKPTGETVEVDGVEVPEMATVPGWHANLLADLSEEQGAALADVLLLVPPEQPYRVWA